MAKRIKLSLEIAGFDEYIEKLDKLGADIKKVIADVYEQCTDDITEDTIEAVKEPNLPAKGKYSTGDTAKSIIRQPKFVWQGSQGEIGLGFDPTKKGVGIILITGTPRMQPVWKLEDIYARKKRLNQVQKDIDEAFTNAINELMEG